MNTQIIFNWFKTQSHSKLKESDMGNFEFIVLYGNIAAV